MTALRNVDQMTAVCFSYRKTPWRDRLLGGGRMSSCAPMAELLVLLLGRCRRALGSLVAAIGGATTAARRRRCVCIVPRNCRRANLHTHKETQIWTKGGPTNTDTLVRRAERQPKTAQISRYTDRQRSAPQPIESHERALHFRKNEKTLPSGRTQLPRSKRCRGRERAAPPPSFSTGKLCAAAPFLAAACKSNSLGSRPSSLIGPHLVQPLFFHGRLLLRTHWSKEQAEGAEPAVATPWQPFWTKRRRRLTLSGSQLCTIFCSKMRKTRE